MSIVPSLMSVDGDDQEAPPHATHQSKMQGLFMSLPIVLGGKRVGTEGALEYAPGFAGLVVGQCLVRSGEVCLRGGQLSSTASALL